MIVKVHKILLVLLSGLLLLSCKGPEKEYVFIDEYRSGDILIPDSLATGALLNLRQAMQDVFWERAHVKNDKVKLPVSRKEMMERGIPPGYYRFLKRDVRMNNRNLKKMIKRDSVLRRSFDETPFETVFENNRKEYWKNRTNEENIHLTLIPPGKITDKVDFDIRAGIMNGTEQNQTLNVSLYWDKEDEASLLLADTLNLPAGKSDVLRLVMPTEGKAGKHKVILKVENGFQKITKSKPIEIITSDIRSIRQISGAWTGIYHWSEIEGKHWNQDIKKMTDSQWREMVRAMKKIEMNMIVIQEVFRNEYYVGKHSLTVDSYEGKAFYPSGLYPGRMPIAAEDPIEAILSEADRQGMQVLVGVGMFAWFDFTPESLEWHKRVAKELWDMYGHHESFYAFYVSEESGGGLDNWENTAEKRQMRKDDIVNFFREFKAWTNSFAPGKPVMLATNSFEVPNGMDTYPKLLEHLDILCPFGFARMPENDLTGKEAADMLQKVCDEAGAHLWFDLESFLFNPDNSLYPRPVDEIIHDLNLFDNFEKILCYQFPGVFNDPEMSVRIGEERTVGLFNGYKKYLDSLDNTNN